MTWHLALLGYLESKSSLGRRKIECKLYQSIYFFEIGPGENSLVTHEDHLRFGLFVLPFIAHQIECLAYSPEYSTSILNVLLTM